MKRITHLFLLLSFTLLATHPAGAKDKFLAPVGTSTKAVTSADNVEAFSNGSGAVAIKDLVYLWSAGSVAKASATTTGQPAIGVVYEIVDATHCLVLTRGVFGAWTTGMTPGQAYYLAETSGTIQTTPVLSATKLAQYVGRAVSTTDLYFNPQNMSLSGTSAGQYVALDWEGKLPAVDGSAITNVSPYAADSWDFSWVTANGDLLSNGWVQGGTQNETTASTTVDGVNCYSLTPSSTSGTAYLKHANTAATGAWELRVKIYLPVSSGTTDNHGVAYNPDTTQSGTKRYQYMASATGIQTWTGSAMATIATTPDLTGRWLDLTVRTYVTSTGLANTWQEVWAGRSLIWSGMSPTALGATTSAGDLNLGRLTVGTVQDVIYIAAIQLRWSGVNQAPPFYTFRAQTYPL